MERRLPRALDPVLGLLGVVFGLGSLTYPYGRDQGLYYYVAREWVVRGAVPYRDVLDHKTPGIYLLYGLGIRLFGETMWGIRVLDVACLVAVGLVAATLSASPGERVRPGVRGATVLATSVLYWGYLNFWNTAQSELWYALFAVGSVAAARHVKRDLHAAAFAGLLAGAALVTKPPALWIVLVAVFLVARRATSVRGAVRPLAAFAAGGAVVPALVLAYFGAKGALPAMVDIVVGANGYYVRHEGGAPVVPGFIGYHRWYFPLVPAILAYLAWGLRRGDRARHRIAAAILAGAYLAVFMQGKFYLLHWTVCVPGFAVVVANAARTLFDALEARGRGWAFGPVFSVGLGALYLGTLTLSPGPEMWWTSTRHAFLYAKGEESRDEFTKAFAEPYIGFFFWTSERVGNWLRERTTPDDLVAVRGFQPEIYAVANRRHGGRFFWTTFITNPSRAYRRAEWLKEDLDALKATPPKYVVALSAPKEGPDSVAFFHALGYRTAEVMWEFTILERGPSP